MQHILIIEHFIMYLLSSRQLMIDTKIITFCNKMMLGGTNILWQTGQPIGPYATLHKWATSWPFWLTEPGFLGQISWPDQILKTFLVWKTLLFAQMQSHFHWGQEPWTEPLRELKKFLQILIFILEMNDNHLIQYSKQVNINIRFLLILISYNH